MPGFGRGFYADPDAQHADRAGGFGNDTLNGGNQDHQLDGGAGIDVLNGGGFNGDGNHVFT